MPPVNHAALYRIEPAGDPTRGSVVVVGGANMDISAVSVLPIVAQDSNPGHVRYSPGGVARNIAENLARLGQNTQLISLVGDDMPGQTLLRHTADAGVDMRATQVLPAHRTASYVSLQGPDGDMAVAVNDMEILKELAPQQLEQYKPVLDAATALVLDCNLSSAALDWLHAHYGQKPIKVDSVSVAKCLRIQKHLRSIDTLKVNRLEAQALTGFSVVSVAEARQAAENLCAMGVRFALISLGAQGTVWCDSQGPAVHLAAHATSVVSTTGAGDALLSGLVDAQCRGFDSASAVAWGMACAEITLAALAANAPNLSHAAVVAHLAATTA